MVHTAGFLKPWHHSRPFHRLPHPIHIHAVSQSVQPSPSPASSLCLSSQPQDFFWKTTGLPPASPCNCTDPSFTQIWPCCYLRCSVTPTASYTNSKLLRTAYRLLHGLAPTTSWVSPQTPIFAHSLSSIHADALAKSPQCHAFPSPLHLYTNGFLCLPRPSSSPFVPSFHQRLTPLGEWEISSKKQTKQNNKNNHFLLGPTLTLRAELVSPWLKSVWRRTHIWVLIRLNEKGCWNPLRMPVMGGQTFARQLLHLCWVPSWTYILHQAYSLMRLNFWDVSCLLFPGLPVSFLQKWPLWFWILTSSTRMQWTFDSYSFSWWDYFCFHLFYLLSSPLIKLKIHGIKQYLFFALNSFLLHKGMFLALGCGNANIPNAQLPQLHRLESYSLWTFLFKDSAPESFLLAS